jgi:hypothetical protein
MTPRKKSPSFSAEERAKELTAAEEARIGALVRKAVC